MLLLLLGGLIGYALFNVRIAKDGSGGYHVYYNTTKVDTTSKSWKKLF
jgi:hypothetical protein